MLHNFEIYSHLSIRVKHSLNTLKFESYGMPVISETREKLDIPLFVQNESRKGSTPHSFHMNL